MIIPLAGFGAALITAFYMFRLIFLTFFGNPKNEKIYSSIHESPKAMIAPLIILSVLSFAFVFTFPKVNPLSGSGWFDSALHEQVEGDHHAEHSKHPKLVVKHFSMLLPGADKKYDINEVEHHIHEYHDQAMFLSLLVAFLFHHLCNYNFDF